jgi:hypothetical protein
LLNTKNNVAAGNNVVGTPKSVEDDKISLLMVPHGLEMRDRSKNTEISATGKGIPKRHMSTRTANGLAMILAEATTAIISIVRMNTVASMADLGAAMSGDSAAEALTGFGSTTITFP